MKALYEVKQVVSTFISTYFGRPQLEHTIKTNCINVKAVDPKICFCFILWFSDILIF